MNVHVTFWAVHLTFVSERKLHHLFVQRLFNAWIVCEHSCNVGTVRSMFVSKYICTLWLFLEFYLAKLERVDEKMLILEVSN